MSFWYLGTPYSGYKDVQGLDYAFQLATKQAALFVAAGVCVYTPIVHSHPIANYMDNHLDHNVWLPFDEVFMQLAQGLVICMLPGWDKSRGMAHEIKNFLEAGKPIIYMEPGVLPSLFANQTIIPEHHQPLEEPGSFIVGPGNAGLAEFDPRLYDPETNPRGQSGVWRDMQRRRGLIPA